MSVCVYKRFYSSDSTDAEISDKEETANPEESECSVECSKVSVKESPPLPQRTNQIGACLFVFRLFLPIDAKVFFFFVFIGAGDTVPAWPLRESLFPHIPPYISFNTHDAETPFSLPPGRRYLKWKLSTITPIVVRKTLQNTGFQLIRSEFSRGVHSHFFLS